jgi:hypothetical protein
MNRNSTGKIKASSYSQSYSSFGQFQNGVSHSMHHDAEEPTKIQKKSSLKEILKNKKCREEIVTKTSITGSQNNAQKYYKKNVMSATVYKENKLGRFT